MHHPYCQPSNDVLREIASGTVLRENDYEREEPTDDSPETRARTRASLQPFVDVFGRRHVWRVHETMSFVEFLLGIDGTPRVHVPHVKTRRSRSDGVELSVGQRCLIGDVRDGSLHGGFCRENENKIKIRSTVSQNYSLQYEYWIQ